jgi:signal transduction histidine kinase
MLVNSDGSYLQADDPSREWAWLLGGQHSFRTDYSPAWNQGRSLQSGRVRAGADHFAFQRLSPGRRETLDGERSHNQTLPEANSLILVTRASPSLATAQSAALLNQLVLLSAGVLAVIAVLLFYWARFSVIREIQERRLVDSESRLRELSSLLLSAQESERRNLSRDLHDQLGQQMTALKLDLRRLEKKWGGPEADPFLHKAIEHTDELLKSLHEIATRVRPSVLDDLGLPEAVESFVAQYEQRTGISVTTELDFHRREIPAAVGENVYRVLQEALSNVAHHAQVDRVEVMMETDETSLKMRVRDPGVGFDEQSRRESNRLGILGMRERVELLGGEFQMQSAPGAGTEVIVELPLEQQKKYS